MMAAPAHLPDTSYYVLDNMPPVCLTDSLLPEDPANILLLDCAALNSILYTISCEQDRSIPGVTRALSFTCTDHSARYLARAVLVYTLLHDNEDPDLIWDIYFQRKLSMAAHKLLMKQCKVLLAASETGQQWTSEYYFLGFCTDSTRLALRKYWLAYSKMEAKSKMMPKAMAQLDKDLAENLDFAQEQAMNMGHFRLDPDENFLAMWRQGEMLGVGNISSGVRIVNPTFVETYGTSAFAICDTTTHPLQSFNLSRYMCKITRQQQTKLNFRSLVSITKQHFEWWGEDFQKQLKHKNIRIWFFVGNPFNFCYALQCYQTKKVLESGIYLSSSSDERLVLEKSSYTDKRKGVQLKPAPTIFNVIETAGLAQRFGIINVLTACVPLLAKTATAALYTEATSEGATEEIAKLDEHVYDDFTVLSALLGIIPGPLVTAFSFDSSAHQFAEDYNGWQSRYRILWKDALVADYTVSGEMPAVVVKTIFQQKEFTNYLFLLYLKMFCDQKTLMDLGVIDTYMQELSVFYTAESFAVFLKLVRPRVDIDWESVMGNLLQMIQETDMIIRDDDRTGESSVTESIGMRRMNRKNRRVVPDSIRDYYEELCTQLFLHGVYCVPFFHHQQRGNPDSPYQPVCTLTVTIPSPLEKWTPTYGGADVSYEVIVGAKDWYHSFSSVHVTPAADMQSTKVRFSMPYYLLQKAPGETYMSLKLRKSRITECDDPSWFEEVSTVPLRSDCAQPERKEDGIQYIEAGRITLDCKSDMPPPQQVVTVWLTDDAERVHRFSFGKLLEEAETICSHDRPIHWISKSLCSAVVSIGVEQQSMGCPFPVSRWSTNPCNLERTDPTAYLEFTAFPEPGACFRYVVSKSFVHPNIPVPWGVSRLNLDALTPVTYSRDLDGRWMRSVLNRTFRDKELSQSEHDHTTNEWSYNLGLVEHFKFFLMDMVFGSVMRNQVFVYKAQLVDAAEIFIFMDTIRFDYDSNSFVLDVGYLVAPPNYHRDCEESLSLLNPQPLSMPKGALDIVKETSFLRMFRRMLVQSTERCRKWSHKQNCQYKTNKHSDLREDALCQCGRGELNPTKKKARAVAGVGTEWGANAPKEWIPFRPVLTRGALGIPSAVPWLHKITRDKCDYCKADIGTSVLRCQRCRFVRFCSVSCAMKDKNHKQVTECKYFMTTSKADEEEEEKDRWYFLFCSGCGKLTGWSKLLYCDYCSSVQYCTLSCRTADWEYEHSRKCPRDKAKACGDREGNNRDGPCLRCKAPIGELVAFSCSNCKFAWYCSRQCLKLDLETHRPECCRNNVGGDESGEEKEKELMCRHCNAESCQPNPTYYDGKYCSMKCRDLDMGMHQKECPKDKGQEKAEAFEDKPCNRCKIESCKPGPQFCDRCLSVVYCSIRCRDEDLERHRKDECLHNNILSESEDGDDNAQDKKDGKGKEKENNHVAYDHRGFMNKRPLPTKQHRTDSDSEYSNAFDYQLPSFLR